MPAFLHSGFSHTFPILGRVVVRLEEPVRHRTLDDDLIGVLVALVLTIVLLVVVGERIW